MAWSLPLVTTPNIRILLVSIILMDVSVDPLAQSLPSALNATQRTPCLC